MNLDRRLLQLARQSRLALMLTVGLGFAAGVLTALQAGLLSRVIARGFLDRQGLGETVPTLAALLLVMLARAALAWGSELSANAIASRVKVILRADFYRRLLDLGPAYVSSERSGELANTALEGIEALDAYFSQYLPTLVIAALTPLTFLMIVFPIDLLSGLVLLLTAPLIPIFMILIGSLAQTLTQRQWQTLSRMSAYFLDVLQGLTTLKILGRSQAQAETIRQVSDRFRQVTMGVLRVTFLSALVLEMVATLSTAVAAVQVGLRLLYGWLTFEQAFFVLLLAPEFYLPLRLLGARFHAGMSGVEAAKRIFAILEQSPATSFDPSEERPSPELSAPPAIRLEGVSVSYTDGRAALKNVTLDIPAGQKVALVGPSGAGKSTIASLLLRFIEPDKGQIFVNQQPLMQIRPELWRERIAWVSQTPYLFDDTALANIQLARPQASREQTIWAARQAEAHDFIAALPQGYYTRIGEHGARLSGGQAQRIALARAFLREAPLVVLDEPTANLDLESEELIQKSLERLLLNKTCLIIAHRLNTVLNADQIVVLDQGEVIARGRHAELLENCQLYRNLIRAYTDILPAAQRLDETVRADAAETTALRPASSVESRPVSSVLLPTPLAWGNTFAGETLSISILLRLLRLLAPYWRWAALSVLMGAATTLSGVGLMSASAYIISAAALHPSIAELQTAIVGVRFFGISRGLFRYLERYLSHQTTFHLLARLRVWFYQALEPLAPARLARWRSGDLFARILGDIESLENFYVRVVAPPLSAIVVGLAVWLFLHRFHQQVAQVWAACWLSAALGIPAVARWLGRHPGRRVVELRAEMSTALVDGIQGMAELIAYGRGAAWADRVDQLSCSWVVAQRKMALINGLQNALSGLLANLSVWFTLIVAIPLIAAGELNGVYLAVLALAALTSFEALNPLPTAMQYLEGNLQAAKRLFEIVDAPAAVNDPAAPLEAPRDFNLQVEGLSFHYPNEDLEANDAPAERRAWVLQQVSFTLTAGKWMAIVGPSGAGKSTLLKLLLRFWDYSEGHIYLGGEDLRRYAQEDVRRCMAVIAQRTYLFNASLCDNLRLARPKASPAEMDDAIRRAQLHSLLRSLPNGCDTWIGEQGQRLSGGERQRLAIARALLKDAPILLLDEPTNGLDALTERSVMEAIFQAARGRSLLLVTHRLIGLERMDEILVLEGGRVIERGRHTQLIRASGLYRRLWELQNQALEE
jgi:ATP-binding cassette subfamily C protein CydCD